jgi:hypothetical protein
MTCNSPDSLILEAKIDNNIVTTKDGLVIPDAKHFYTNGGKGNGVLFTTASGELIFVHTDLNTNVTKELDIWINNLEFKAVGTDPLALETKTVLLKIKLFLEQERKNIP